jgi:hypothetical protein
VLGLEYVSFSNVMAQLNKNNQFTPPDQFSSHGWIYGLDISETFKLGEKYQIKANQLIYRETYGTQGTNNGWNYYYLNSSLNTNQDSLAPGTVFMIEFSFLY